MNNYILELTKMYLEVRHELSEEEKKIILRTLEMAQLTKHEPSHIDEFPKFYMNICSKCGMDFSGITGYVCSALECPMGAGPNC